MDVFTIILIFGCIVLGFAVVLRLVNPKIFRLPSAKGMPSEAEPVAQPGIEAEPPAMPVKEPSILSPDDDLAAREGQLAERVRQADQADQLRNMLISKMSHDIRTPLNSVITLSQLLFEGNAGALAYEQRKYVEIIHRNGQSLLSLINDILDLAGIEAGRLEVEVVPVDLRHVMQAAGAAAAPLAQKKGLAFHVNVPKKLTLARADEERLRQVIVNLAEHAVKQTSNGYVELSVETYEQSALIRVSDTGAGNTQEIRNALFDDYLAGLGPFAARAEGASPGLGLVMAGRLTKLMGGQITVDSAMGEGNTFTITLPAVTDDVPVRPRDEEPISTDPATGHVLLIEDDVIERRRVGAILENAGYEVTLVGSGQEGLLLLRDGQFDAVVLDLVMPGMSGLDVLRALRSDERTAALPCVVLSALYMTKSERAVLGPAVVGVVRKGESIGEELTTHLRRAIKTTSTRSNGTPSPVPRARVLVVDDNADNLFTIKQVLSALPVVIETAASGYEAIEICRQRRPDLIMMDVELPGISGLDATRAIHELPECKDIPIIALTAEAMKGDRERFLAAQCSDYLPKPIQPLDVVSAVTRALHLEAH
jgi:CheY-like chemotaxis protein/signal transduction histidine kinase